MAEAVEQLWPVEGFQQIPLSASALGTHDGGDVDLGQADGDLRLDRAFDAADAADEFDRGHVRQRAVHDDDVGHVADAYGDGVETGRRLDDLQVRAAEYALRH